MLSFQHGVLLTKLYLYTKAGVWIRIVSKKKLIFLFVFLDCTVTDEEIEQGLDNNIIGLQNVALGKSAEQSSVYDK